MGNIYVNIAFEDALSEIVIQRILVHAGEKANRKFVILRRYRGRGFGGLKAKIEKFNAASVITPYVVLTDLDQNKCPVALVKEWLKCDLHANMIFRIAVREVEAWLLADEDKLRAYLSVNKVYRVENPDSIEDPKNFIFQMVRKSKSKVIKDAILPKPGGHVGPDYNGVLGKFVLDEWDVERATERSESLRRMVKALVAFGMRT